MTISRLLKENNALEKIEPELNPKRYRDSEQHSLIVLDIVCKVFYFLLAIPERFTSDDPVAYIKEKSPRISNPRALKILSYDFYIAPKY